MARLSYRIRMAFPAERPTTFVVAMKIRTPRNKYLRLLMLIIVLGLFSALWGFALLYFWEYGLSAPPLSTQEVVARAGQALKLGMWAAVSGGFPMWLALEEFPRRKKRRANTSPAVPSDIDA